MSFLPSLLRGAYVLLGDVGLAEDAVQGAMLRVFRRWDEARAAPEIYSRKALVSVCQDHWRRQRRRPQEVLVADLALMDRVAVFSDQVEEREAREQALIGLPPLQREIVALRFFLDFSVAETAQLLEIPEGTVKSSTHRALQQLRNRLPPPEGEVKAC
jgi:RNA polymerase sigma factor (sigma-70 family)